MRQEQIYRQLKQHLPQGWFQPARSRQGFGFQLLWALAYLLAEFVSFSESLQKEIPPITASGKFLDRHLRAIGSRRLSGESDEQARSRYLREWQQSRNTRGAIVRNLKALLNSLVFLRADPIATSLVASEGFNELINSEVYPVFQYTTGFDNIISLDPKAQPTFLAFPMLGVLELSASSGGLSGAIQSDLYFPVFQYTTGFDNIISLDARFQPSWLATPIIRVDQSGLPSLATIELFSRQGAVEVSAQSDSPSSGVALIQDEIPPLSSFAAGILPFLRLRFSDVERSPLADGDYFTSWENVFAVLRTPFCGGSNDCEARVEGTYVLKVKVNQLRDWTRKRDNLLAVHRQASQLVSTYPWVFVLLPLFGQFGNYRVLLGGEEYLPFLGSSEFSEILIRSPKGVIEVQRNGVRVNSFEIDFLEEEVLILRINHE